MAQKEIDLSVFVEAMGGVFLLSKQAIQTEVSIAFVVFHECGDTSVDSKKVLRQVYADAGRADCLRADSPSYQTVTRRINRCAAFFEIIGQKKVKRMLKDKFGQEAIDLIRGFLEPFEIETMEDVAVHAGRPTKKDADHLDGKEDVQTEPPGTVHVRTRHIDIALTPDVPKAEILKLAKKLLDYANQMN